MRALDVHVCEVCGVPVPRWADRERWPSRCVEHRKAGYAAKQRAYYEQNREQLAAKQRAYYEQNREQLAAKQRAYYEQNREQLAAKQRAYREQNRDEIADGVLEADGACPWCAVGRHEDCAGGTCRCHGTIREANAS